MPKTKLNEKQIDIGETYINPFHDIPLFNEQGQIIISGLQQLINVAERVTIGLNSINKILNTTELKMAVDALDSNNMNHLSITIAIKQLQSILNGLKDAAD